MSSDQPTKRTIEESGYTFSNKGQCIGCHAPIDWYWTPDGKKMPMDPMNDQDSPAISHFATCPEAGRFRKKP
jgi:hypothetical protein